MAGHLCKLPHTSKRKGRSKVNNGRMHTSKRKKWWFVRFRPPTLVDDGVCVCVCIVSVVYPSPALRVPSTPMPPTTFRATHFATLISSPGVKLSVKYPSRQKRGEPEHLRYHPYYLVVVVLENTLPLVQRCTEGLVLAQYPVLKLCWLGCYNLKEFRKFKYLLARRYNKL